MIRTETWHSGSAILSASKFWGRAEATVARRSCFWTPWLRPARKRIGKSTPVRNGLDVSPFSDQFSSGQPGHGVREQFEWTFGRGRTLAAIPRYYFTLV